MRINHIAYNTPSSNAHLEWIQAHIFRHVGDICAYRAHNGPLYTQLTDALYGRGGTCITATSDGLVIGYVIANRTKRAGRDHGEILALYVIEASRRKGVGTRLLQIAVEWILAADVVSISVFVSPYNATAIRLYEAVGFKPATLEMEIEADSIRDYRSRDRASAIKAA